MTDAERRAALEPLMKAARHFGKSTDAHPAVEQAAVAFAIALYEKAECVREHDGKIDCVDDRHRRGTPSLPEHRFCNRCRELYGWRSIAEEMRR